MKKSLKLVLMYFMMFLSGLIIGTFFYSLFSNVIGYIAGQKLNFFDLNQIVNGAFIVSYCLCFLIIPLLCYYRVRHPHGIAQTIAFILLVIINWGAVFPGLGLLERVRYDYIPVSNKISHLSGGYFRQKGDKVYYFTKDFYSNPYTGEDTNTVIIDTTENGKVTLESVKDDPGFELYQSYPYNEIQVKEAFVSHNLDTKFDLRLLVDRGLNCFNSGILYYLGFVSIGFVLSALYAMTTFFEWKLLNACFTFLASMLIFCINTFFYTDMSAKIIGWFGKFSFINLLYKIFENPVLVLLNCLCGIILIVIGIVHRAIVNHKKKAAE